MYFVFIQHLTFNIYNQNYFHFAVQNTVLSTKILVFRQYKYRIHNRKEKTNTVKNTSKYAKETASGLIQAKDKLHFYTSASSVTYIGKLCNLHRQAL